MGRPSASGRLSENTVSGKLLQKRSRKKKHIHNCSSVPRELLNLIFNCLSNNPIYSWSFGAVSKEWRDIVVANKRHIIPRAMIMMVEDGKDDLNTHGLYSLSSPVNKWGVCLPEHRGKKIVASDNGWLVIVDGRISLLNPLTKHRILLPFLERTLQRLEKNSVNDLLDKKGSIFNLKFNSPSKYHVAICFCGSLLFCKAGDMRWGVRQTFNKPDSVLHYKDKLYVSMGGHVHVHNIDSPHPKYIHSPGLNSTTYLVESRDKGLLLVVRKEVYTTRGCEYDTYGFEVFLLVGDIYRGWVRVDNLGKEVLFVGVNAICLPAQSVPECNANSVYFTDNSDEKSWSDMGVFDMKDESIKPLYQDCPFVPAPSIWFTPNMQSK